MRPLASAMAMRFFVWLASLSLFISSESESVADRNALNYLSVIALNPRTRLSTVARRSAVKTEGEGCRALSMAWNQSSIFRQSSDDLCSNCINLADSRRQALAGPESSAWQVGQGISRRLIKAS